MSDSESQVTQKAVAAESADVDVVDATEAQPESATSAAEPVEAVADAEVQANSEAEVVDDAVEVEASETIADDLEVDAKDDEASAEADDAELSVSDSPAGAMFVIEEDDKAIVRLTEVVGVEQLEALHQELRGIFDNPPVSIEIDAEDVEVIDFCGAQLLASFANKASSQGIKVDWENVSIPVFQTATELDFCQALGL